MTCIVCEEPFMWRWTDTHGVAQCVSCGTPYTILHYEGDKSVEKPPECCVQPHWLPLLRKYRADTSCKIPGGYSFAEDYEVAQPRDFAAFKAWCDENRAAIDAAKALHSPTAANCSHKEE